MTEIIARIFNQQGGGVSKISEGGGILLTLRTVTRGEGRVKLSPKTALRNV